MFSANELENVLRRRAMQMASCVYLFMQSGEGDRVGKAALHG